MGTDDNATHEGLLCHRNAQASIITPLLYSYHSRCLRFLLTFRMIAMRVDKVADEMAPAVCV